MSCVEGEGCLTLQEGERELKSEALSCGLTTHLRVVGNFGSRGRALCGFSTAISFISLPLYPAQVSLKGAAFRGPEERGSLSREEIVFPPPRAEIFLPRASSFLRERGKENTASSDASPDALGFASRINFRLIIKTTEFTRKGK